MQDVMTQLGPLKSHTYVTPLLQLCRSASLAPLMPLMATSYLMLILALLLTFAITANTAGGLAHTSYLKKGSSLSVERASDIIQSSDGTFSFGFYNISSTAFTISIWFTNSADRTIAWSANRDRPVHGSGSKIVLNKHGTLVLIDYDGTVVWQANTSSKGADLAELMDSGNLVMRDQGGNILWQSFDHPTDTLLPTQPVTATAKLVSTDLSRPSSYYTLRFDDRYILSLAYDGPEISNLYWPNPDFSSWLNYRISYNRSRRGVLDNLGQFLASDNTSFVSSDWGPGIKRRLTLDYDGNLRLYSLNDSNGSWSVSWMAFSQPCEIHGICGWNGICVYTPAPACSCPPGYVVRDPSDWSKGCKSTFNISCRDSDQQMGFVSLPQTDFWGSDLDYIPMTSLDACRTQCLNSCSCLAFEYKLDSNDCYLKSVLLNGKTVPGYPGTAHLKVPQNLLSETIAYVHENSETLDCISSNTKVEVLAFDSDAYSNGGKATMWHYYYGFLAAFFLIEVCFIAFGWWFIVKKQSTQSEIWAAEEGYRMVTDHFRSFTYKELREATKNFKDQLGHGRYGSVYKGILHDKRVVAVKKLGDVKQGEDEFETEVSVIGRIYHMNLVRVWGVCSERKHRLLVFEYVDNGSLAVFLFGNRGLLQWDQRYKIAVGVAKGLAYLHHECLDWIVHCDVKPENILLDNDFEPKISDFGVAKLLQRDHQTEPNVSKVHGTRGYAAPEWASNIPINEKVDVYSYGVVLLELVAGRRAFELAATGTGDAEVAMRQLVRTIREKLKSGDWSWITGFVDPRLNGNIVHSEVSLMLEVAAICMEKERSRRPSMNDIVEKFQFLSCK